MIVKKKKIIQELILVNQVMSGLWQYNLKI